MEAYENSSSGPTANTSIDGLQHRSKSAGSGKESAGSSGGNTPRFLKDFVRPSYCFI